MNQDENKQQNGIQNDDQMPEDNHSGESKWKAFFAKRWAFPALYLMAAAFIIALMYGQAHRMVNVANNDAAGQAVKTSQPAAVTTATTTSFVWPIAPDTTDARVVRGFFDANAKGATLQTLAADLVSYDQSYQGSTGVDIAMAGNSKTFGVVAASAGTVTDVRNSPVMGWTVVIQSANGYTETYQSLGTVDVKEGQQVTQGQDLGASGYNQREASLGNHLFFEVEKNGVAVDPSSLLPKSMS
ncbi:MAG: M23 family metallopeptidase [Acidibacillus sp.]|nr:M23 family metallopeptidase [Acidibacillus sp.]